MTPEASPSLESAVRRLRQAPGDEAAWAALHGLMLPQVLMWSRHALGGSTRWTEAEDVAQEVFLHLAQVVQAGRLELPTSEHGLYSLLAVMTRNRATDFRRREHRLARDADRQRPLAEDLPAGPAADELEARDLLEHLLASLDRFDQRLLWMRLDGLTHDEVAERLNVSAKTVQRHLGHIAKVYNDLRDEVGGTEKKPG
jgi:RNA polymerase sigma factor (sigma-70 family)